MLRSLSFVASGPVKELGIETIEFNFVLNKTGVCSWLSIEFELNGSFICQVSLGNKESAGKTSDEEFCRRCGSTEMIFFQTFKKQDYRDYQHFK